MTDGSVHRCELRTRRLVVGDWHELSDRFGLDLVEVVGGILTPITTSELPPTWQGHYDDARAAGWIDDRDDESPTHLVVEHRTSRAVGLLILFASHPDALPGATEVRIGYVIAESAWGRGIASELVGALVAWGRSQPSIGSLAAGVADRHHASARVLTKNGFHQVGTRDGERIYRIALDTGTPIRR